MKSGYKETFCKEKEQLKTDLPMKWRWKWYFFPNLSSLTIDLQYIRMLSLDRQPTCEANILLQNGLRARRLIIYQMAFSHFMLFHPLLIHRNCACFSYVSLYSQLFLHGSPSAQGWPASLGADHQVQQVHDPGRTICTSLTKNNVEICSFPEELQPPGTSVSKPAKGCTLLMQFWFWLFVQEFTCTVVTAGSGSSAMRSKETNVPVLHPVSQYAA